ncbi:MAG: response regulator transcription factor [Opitutaceae bacterium]|nr:response regulator transcription factor [Opitutaceae bacterium]
MAETRSKRILIVDDEPDVTELVGYQLRAKGFAVEALNDPTQSIAKIRAYQPDLVILDVMMPDIGGIQICRMLRADPKTKAIPVIFLTAKAEEADRVLGLEVGGDDYICKPFSLKELILRVQGLLRRHSGPGDDQPKRLEIGSIVLDNERHQVTIKGAPVELTATEFRLLRLLMERKGRVQTREHLLLNVWNYETEIETRTVDTHVRRLREKLGAEADRIETLRGVGYRMVENPVSPCSS